jgi:hypothetical protein
MVYVPCGPHQFVTFELVDCQVDVGTMGWQYINVPLHVEPVSGYACAGPIAA